MPEPDGEDPALRSLARIARALGIPIEALYRLDADDRSGPHEVEEQEVLSLFRRLADASDRRRCLDLMRAMARRPGDGSEGAS